MRQELTNSSVTQQVDQPHNRRVRVSTMRLLAAGALLATSPALAQTAVTTPEEFANFLNSNNVEELEITGGDLDLTSVSPLELSAVNQIIQGDGVTRTLTNGDLTISGNRILAINPDAVWDGELTITGGARLDVVDPGVLGVTAMVEAEEEAEIRIFGIGSTYDATFWGKIDGEDDSTRVSFGADGESILTALPTFDGDISLVVYDSFQFNDAPLAPLVDPLVSLGATLAGNHNVIINVGTLNLDDFDFTIDSLAGEGDTEITLGSGTLTTGDGQNTTYAGVISGTGNLVKTGPGIFTLTGVNTYTGTTTVSGGILDLQADQTGPTAIIVQNTGTLWVNADQTGTPTYAIQNGGTVVLNADVADTTMATIDAGGLLELNNVDQTFATVMGGGTLDLGDQRLTVGDATDFTFGGVIQGDGGFNKAGAGNLTLSGMSTFLGVTNLNEGTITLDGTLDNTSAVNLAAGTTLVLNGDINDNALISIAGGATLDLNDNDETLGQVTGSGAITLGSGTLTLGTNSNFAFGGTISETGGIIKQGAGTLTLTGAQTFTGATVVGAGTLIANGDLDTSGVTVQNGATFNLESTLTSGTADVTVDDGGTLFGTGTIGDDLVNNGLVTFLGPGAGDTLTVNDDYTQGATGTLEIQLGNAGGLVVAGTATLGGTLNISVPADPANFDIGASYNVITAGSTSGNFAAVTDNFAFLDLTSTNVGGNVQITLARNAVALNSIANTTNQNTIATVLDGLGAPTGTLDQAIDRILASSEAGARATYDDLAGAGAATTGTQTAANAVNQSHRLLDQIIGVAPGTSRPIGAFSQAPNSSGPDEIDHLTLLSFYQGAFEEPAEEAEGGTFAGLNPVGWGAFYGGFGDQGDGAEGLDYTRYGLLVGLELESDETAAQYGVSLGVEMSEFDFNQDNGAVDITSLYLAGYTRQPFAEDWHFTVGGTLGYHQHESARNILIGVTPTTASADFDSFSATIAAELSKSFVVIDTPADPGGHPTHTSIEPFVRLAYSISSQDGYTETGAGAAGLTVSSETSTACAPSSARVSSTSTCSPTSTRQRCRAGH
ncbi:MAG: autotransporter domain-containing protein [Planctomycetota bacterium]